MKQIDLTRPIQVKHPAHKRRMSTFAASAGGSESGPLFLVFFLANGDTCMIENILHCQKKAGGMPE